MSAVAEELLGLADRCEKATGPDRELDLSIAIVVNYGCVFDDRYVWRWGIGGDEIEGWQDGKRKPSAYLDPAQFAPSYTASLDAAMTLVPEGLCWRLGVNGDPKAKLLGGSAASILSDNFGADIAKAGAATPALALCAAALRARAAQGGDQ